MASLLPSFSATLNDLEPFSRIQLLAVDIDGTLLNPTREAPMGTLRRQVARLRAQRSHTIIATGRAFAGARPFIEGLGLANEPAILYNGAIITSNLNGPPVHAEFVDPYAVKLLVQACEADRSALWTYHWGHMLQAEHVTGWGTFPYPPNEINSLPVSTPSHHDSEFTDVVAALIQHNGAGALVRKALTALADSALISTTTSGTGYWEVRPAGSSKAKALALISSGLGLSTVHTAAVGDNHNDLEMLARAGVSVAVRNATDDVKNACDFITRADSTEGVYELFQVLMEARRYHRGGVFPLNEAPGGAAPPA